MLPAMKNGAFGASPVNAGAVTGSATVKNTTFDSPLPGAGFETVMNAVPAEAMSDARIDAVNLLVLMKLVVRELPFQFIMAPGTKPVPFTASVKAGPPGVAAVGTGGSVSSGIGFNCPHAVDALKVRNRKSIAKRQCREANRDWDIERTSCSITPL
jgi:hypothetical protein